MTGGVHNPLAIRAKRNAPVTAAFCWAHGRRAFFELADIAKKIGVAFEAVHQAGGEPDAMAKIQSERRHRRDRVSRFWKQRSGGAQERECEVMCGFGVERKKKRAKKALVNHLPMQNWLKMESSKSSIVVLPTISSAE